MSASVQPCPVCAAELRAFDTATVLGEYAATYFRCSCCGLVTTPSTPWLQQAYSSAIHHADQGLLRRARLNAKVVSAVIRSEGLRGGRFLDWAAGYGVFTADMRERGFDFWQYDEYARPLFAPDFRDDGSASYDLITAFEVLEHLADPATELAALAARSDRLLFTTELLPEPAPRVAEWWYYMPDVGQHITFHTPRSLRELGARLGLQVTTNGVNWHLFTRRPPGPRTRALFAPWAIQGARRVQHLRWQLRHRTG